MFLGFLLLRTDQQEPHHDKDEDEGRELQEHVGAARGRSSGLCPSFGNEHELAP
jgi:hypothetical protein